MNSPQSETTSRPYRTPPEDSGEFWKRMEKIRRDGETLRPLFQSLHRKAEKEKAATSDPAPDTPETETFTPQQEPPPIKPGTITNPSLQRAALIVASLAASVTWWAAYIIPPSPQSRLQTFSQQQRYADLIQQHRQFLIQHLAIALGCYACLAIGYIAWAKFSQGSRIKLIERALKAGLCVIAIYLATGLAAALIAIIHALFT